MDEARIISLHGNSTGPLARARRLAERRTDRPKPGPGRAEAEAEVLPMTTRPDPAAADPRIPAPIEAPRPAWRTALADVLSFAERRIDGNYELDEFGFDADLAEHALVPFFAPLYQRWFRVEVNGIENVPDEGPALLVGNHAGGLWALDSAMVATAVHTEHPNHRFVRMLAAGLVFRTPFVGPLARKGGATMACIADVDRLLAAGELVGVWPEGFKGIGKPFSERYKLQRFGRGGFVQSAIRAGVPIIPVSVIGSEEIHPVLGNAKTLARILNVPYFPLTPTFPWLGPLGLIPLPSKWYIEFGDPIHTENLPPDAAEDMVTVFETADRVRETIQSTLYRLLVQRRSTWR